MTRVRNQLRLRAKGRKIMESADGCRLQETQLPCSSFFMAENNGLSSQDLHYWELCPVDTDG